MIRSACAAILGLALGAGAGLRAEEATPVMPRILAQEAGAPFLPDFSYAGFDYGRSAPPAAKGRVILVDKYGAKPDDDIDDSKAILKALDAARAVKGPAVLRFSPGRYIVTEILRIDRGEIVLQGAGQGDATGAGGTELHFPRPLRMVGDDGSLDELRAYLKKYEKRQREEDRNLDRLFSEYSWSGGFIWVGREKSRPAPYVEEADARPGKIADIASGKRGARAVSLSAPTALTAGDRIEILWYNNAGAGSPTIQAIYAGGAGKVGSHHWDFPDRPLVRQPTTVEAVEGLEITLASPLLHDISADVPAEIGKWEPLLRVGIEDLHLTFPTAAVFGHHMEEGYNGIYLTGVADSWIRNVSITDADSGVLTYDSANVTISDIRVDGDRAAHYAVHMGNVHNMLAERIQVYNPTIHSLTFNTQSTKCVYKDSEVFNAAVLDQHAGANHQNLFDNVTLHVSALRGKKGAYYPVYDGSGASYWQPGHGAFSTTWNLRVVVESGAYDGETVQLQGLDEGPSANIVGVYGNRPFSLDYRPQPYVESLNQRVEAIPSLYDFQLAARKRAGASR